MKQLILFICIVWAFTSCKNDAKVSNENNSEPQVESQEVNYDIETLDNAQLASGTLQRLMIPSDFIEDRPVDVWLPADYSDENSYAVLYMHDGQMLFDSTTTWNKQEWKVDEWASQLMDEGETKDFIVVGIHNISEIRWFDLFPQKAWDYLDPKVADSIVAKTKADSTYRDLKGDNYLIFLTKELKPIIDEEYSVRTDKENTFVAGSSMGGLMSMYAISEYPEVFQGAACISTHWVGAMPQENNPFPDAIFQYMAENFPKAGNNLAYFDYGNETLDQYYPQYAPRVDAILTEKGYTEKDSQNLFFEGTNHSENAWNQRLDKPFIFLLGK
ncbi:alpha/beta hydrolase [Winogradskyella aurantiaca]|uniref:alpha/beta hydrolase n=1 Tax=Winogradskyella aurantiaca TaxID=2219558 RepID=UPI000E1D715A|nr:alpha/beta fold hydrolase [Winogradskyella aurantiaca]